MEIFSEFGNIYITILAWIVIIVLSVYLGYFLRGTIRNGRAIVINEENIVRELLISFVVGLIAIVFIYHWLSEFFTKNQEE
ncbi:MAG: hypothetical protein JWQ63_1976 [Mucilaginibacter sp.]|nr:hypothetical protein [Mucilaginibacter sp.]